MTFTFLGWTLAGLFGVPALIIFLRRRFSRAGFRIDDVGAELYVPGEGVKCFFGYATRDKAEAAAVAYLEGREAGEE